MCAAALAVISEIEEAGLLEHTRQAGAYLVERLSAAQSPFVSEIRALGLMIGVEVTAEVHQKLAGPGDQSLPSLLLTKRLMDEGLLVIPAGERTIRLLPPLNVTFEDLDRAADVLLSVLA
jgi:4-aminobutyrate aminotransferase-like enzyme